MSCAEAELPKASAAATAHVERKHACNGVRPSSGAAGPPGIVSSDFREMVRLAELAAPEDGRTPPNRCESRFCVVNDDLDDVIKVLLQGVLSNSPVIIRRPC